MGFHDPIPSGGILGNLAFPVALARRVPHFSWFSRSGSPDSRHPMGAEPLIPSLPRQPKTIPSICQLFIEQMPQVFDE
jgi:hypothetical protein